MERAGDGDEPPCADGRRAIVNPYNLRRYMLTVFHAISTSIKRQPPLSAELTSDALKRASLCSNSTYRMC